MIPETFFIKGPGIVQIKQVQWPQPEIFKPCKEFQISPVDGLIQCGKPQHLLKTCFPHERNLIHDKAVEMMPEVDLNIVPVGTVGIIGHQIKAGKIRGDRHEYLIADRVEKIAKKGGSLSQTCAKFHIVTKVPEKSCIDLNIPDLQGKFVKKS